MELVNTSLTEGIFVNNWKTAIIKTLLKKLGLELITKNYHLVSNLPFMSKLVEKCMLVQLNKHCSNQNLMVSYQSAYRANHSCKTSILKLCNDILWAMERQEIMALVVLDLGTAFDTVNHSVLLNVLHNQFGITGKALNWYDTYLRPHQHYMEITGSRSQPRSIDFSVPQSSCARPTLYSAYAGALQTVIPEGIDLNDFADDHNVKKSFGAGNKVDEKAVISDLELCTTRINEWMNVNRLKMNTDKTEFILLGSRYHLPKCETMSINICGDTVVKSNKIKLLGAWLDENLSFKSHINIKCRTAMYNLQYIRNIRKVLSVGACKTLVH